MGKPEKLSQREVPEEVLEQIKCPRSLKYPGLYRTQTNLPGESDQLQTARNLQSVWKVTYMTPIHTKSLWPSRQQMASGSECHIKQLGRITVRNRLNRCLDKCNLLRKGPEIFCKGESKLCTIMGSILAKDTQDCAATWSSLIAP